MTRKNSEFFFTADTNHRFFCTGRNLPEFPEWNYFQKKRFFKNLVKAPFHQNSHSKFQNFRFELHIIENPEMVHKNEHTLHQSGTKIIEEQAHVNGSSLQPLEYTV